jgi:IS30 family transposase
MEKWSCRNPLTIEERKIIQQGIESGLSSRQIGKEIQREKSIILRESKRLGDLKNYKAELAQQHFEDTQRKGWQKAKQTLLNKRFVS